ncbi:MAG: Cna B-type domain-containing protein [Blautia sp.]|nr:Cna B-type domain-containing protein [Blautia sp.]
MNNTETDEPITVNVDKEWFDIEGDKIENPEGLTAKVQLYQKKNNEDYAAVETITNADGTTYNGEITLPIEGSWEYSWEKLPRIDTDGNGYAYKLEEVEVPVDYVSSYTLNETEDEKSYHLKNYQVTERNVNVSVSKIWLGEDGKTEIDVKDLPEDLENVRFYLYRVISRAPFTTAPMSGGNLYTIEGNPYLVTGASAEDGLYSISRTQFQEGISFEELPSVHRDDGGTWYFYSYYVKEVPVDGYSASVDVTETQDEQNNTILLSSMKNRKKPEERTTDLIVEKAWKDKEGGEKSWPDNTVVQFKLYQVSSTEPFDEQPTSGGILYNAAQVNYNDHPNKVSGEDGLYQMGHTYHGSALYTAQFDDLPEVTIDANEKATYYAYYVDEVEVAGYETAYSYDTSESGKVKVLMTNRQEPDYTQLSVEKKWFDGDNEITDADVLENLSATVELVRYRAVPTGTTVHFIMYNGTEDLASILVPRNQAGVIITIDSIDGGADAKFTQSFSPEDEFYKVSGDWWGWIQGGTTRTITIPDVPDVYVVFGDGTVNSISVSTTSEAGGGPAAIDPTFDSSSYQVELKWENSFLHTYTKLLTAGVGSDGGQTYIYSYGVREVSASGSFAFDSYSVGTNTADSGESNPGSGTADSGESNPGSGTADSQASNPGAGTITVNNKKKSTVDFDILKVAAGTTSPLEGAAFTIQKILETSQTASVVKEGEAVASVPEITGSDGKVSFKGISAGCYEVKETVTPDGYIQTGEGTFYVKVDSSGLHLLEKVITDGKLSYREATTAKVGDVTISTMEGTVTFTVENTPGAALPSTGGPGTNLIYLIGLTFTAFAGAGLVMKKRRRNAA